MSRNKALRQTKADVQRRRVHLRGHSRSGAHSDAWFRPSREDVALYRTLTAAGRALSVKEISKAVGSAPSTVDHSLRYWTQHGLLKRVFLDKKAWYSWAPSEAAREMVEAIQGASALAEQVPAETKKRPRIMARLLRAAARRLHAIANRL